MAYQLAKERWTVVEVTKYEKSEIYKEGGLCDLSLGVNKNFEKCAKCSESIECPGHFGRIKLAKPVFHMGYVETIAKILKCICLKCSRLRRCDEKTKKKLKHIQNPKKRLTEMAKTLSKVKECVQSLDGNNKIKGCGAKDLPSQITVKDFLQILKGNGKESQQQITAEEASAILELISTEDAEMMGFFNESKPKDLIIKQLLVSPPQVRPSIEMNPVQCSHDDLTNVYLKIIKLNNEIVSNPNSKNVDKLIEQLQSIIARLMDNDKERLPALTVSTAKKPVKSIKQRLKGKEGRFRQNLMGKRVDFSARSVVSPDSNLELDELGVPRKLADELTIPEEVNQVNLKRMIELGRLGKIKTLIKPNNDKKSYEMWDFEQSNAQDIEKELNYGVIVERTLEDGDYVLFNRQPTLHKQSMMGHRVRVLPFSTFRLNLSVCTPYNADFDGDEMNMHVPQSYETRAELKHICHVPKQVVSSKSNKPVMGIVQDSLLGVSLFTLRDTFLTKSQVMNLLMWVSDWNGEIPMPAIIKPQPLWTGKQIMSLAIPKEITMHRGKGWFSEDDTVVYILRGELICGIMNKSIVGDGAGGLVHTIWLDINPQATCDFMTQAQRLVNNWLVIYGFTMGCSDIVPTASCTQSIQKILKSADQKYNETRLLFLDGKQISQQNLHKAGKKIMDSFEVKVNNVLNERRQEAEKEAKSTVVFRSNNFAQMVWAGSKGKPTNLAQVLGLVGQQNIEGARITLGFNRRTLPHFCKDDHGLEARGFVKNNFFKGLQPHEFFFHTMGGREGLSDTAVKTSRTGYIQRKLIKALEDVIARYDGTVRDSNGAIIQTNYGEDGLAGEYIEKYDFNCIQMTDKQLEKEYRFLDFEQNSQEIQKQMYNEYSNSLDPTIIQEIVDEVSLQRELEEEFGEVKKARLRLRELFFKPSGFNTIYLPVNIERITESLKVYQSKLGKNKQHCNLNPSLVIQKVNELFKRLDQEMGQRHQIDNLELFKIHVRVGLASKLMCIKHKFTPELMDKLVFEIEEKFKKALVHAGETIGAIAAQSIGEPTTQMTLNTFHFAGVSDRNVTLGVPRLQELLDASKKMKTPSVTIYLDPPLQIIKDEKSGAEKKQRLQEKQQAMAKDPNTEKSREKIESQLKIEEMKRKLQYSILVDYIISTEIYYDPDPQDSVLYELNEEGLNDIFEEDSQLAPWVLLIIFDKQKFINNETWNQIRTCIQNQIENTFNTNSSTATSHILWFQIRPKKVQLQIPTLEDNKNFYEKLVALEDKIRGNFVLGGIKNIRKVYTKKIEIKNFKYKDEATGKFRMQQERILETDGTNLKEILNATGIDSTRTVSNDAYEIIHVLGVEAGRQVLINEIREVIKPYDIYVNYRHLSILVDWMTHRGKLTPINRNGLNRIDGISCLRKSSFEETVEILYDATIFSEIDKMSGVTENIIFGQNCFLGTGHFSLLLDADKIRNYVFKAEDVKDEYQIVYKHQYDTEFGGDDDHFNVAKTPNYQKTPCQFINTPKTATKSPMDNAGNFTPYTPAVTNNHYRNLMAGNNSPLSPTPQGFFTPSGHVRGGNMISSQPGSPYYRPVVDHFSQRSDSPSYHEKSTSPKPCNSPRYTPGFSPNSPKYSNYHSSHHSNTASNYTGQQYSSRNQSPGYSNSQYNSGSVQVSSPHYEKIFTADPKKKRATLNDDVESIKESSDSSEGEN